MAWKIGCAALALLAGMQSAGAGDIGGNRTPIELMVIPEEGLLLQGQEKPYGNEPWLGLYCGPARCELRPTMLKTAPTSIATHYEESIEAQHLTVSGLPHKPLFVMRPHRALSPGPIKSLLPFPGGEPNWISAGDLQLQSGLRLEDGTTLKILPRVIQGSDPREPDRVEYVLRQYGIDQVLAEVPVDEMVGEEGLTLGRRVFVWVGDLDRDGKLDLLLELNNRTGEAIDVQLFLSSYAAKGKAVGLAGRFYYWHPEEPGC